MQTLLVSCGLKERLCPVYLKFPGESNLPPPSGVNMGSRVEVLWTGAEVAVAGLEGVARLMLVVRRPRIRTMSCIGPSQPLPPLQGFSIGKTQMSLNSCHFRLIFPARITHSVHTSPLSLHSYFCSGLCHSFFRPPHVQDDS